MAAFRRSDAVIIIFYLLLPIIYVLGAALGAATGIPSSVGIAGIVMFALASISLVALPTWTIIHVVRARERTAIAVLWIESVFAGLLVFFCLAAFLADRVPPTAGAWPIAIAVGLCIALTPLVRRTT